MAGLDEFYPQSRRPGYDTDDFSRRGYPGQGGRRPLTVPQFESDSGGMFFGSSQPPRLLNLDPSKKRNPDSAEVGPGSADHYAGSSLKL